MGEVGGGEGRAGCRTAVARGEVGVSQGRSG